MKKGILIAFLLLNGIHVYSQSKCSSLRQPNENYGAGDTSISWCQISKPTPYTKCLCEEEKERKTQEQQRISENENFNAETNRLKRLEEQASNTKDYVTAISYLEERINFVTHSNRYQNAEPFYKDEMTKTLYAQLKHYQYKLKEPTGNLSTNENRQTTRNNSVNQEQQDTQNFIDRQNSQLANQEAFNQKLANDLAAKFNTLSENWAKERDFQTKLSSLTRIKSLDASSIISEAKYKAQEINTEYDQKKEDGLNQGLAITQNTINSAQNDQQVVAGSIVGVGLTALAQSNLENERREAQQKLAEDKERALNNLAQQIIDQYDPVKKKHLEAATLAVSSDKESYHLGNYIYATCMVDHAYDIIVDGYPCEQPIKPRPEIRSNTYTGSDYYKAYQRKSQSLFKNLKDRAPYFLELALDKEPQRAEWLYEKALINQLTVFDKASILKKAHDSDPDNEKIKKAYENTINAVQLTIAAEQQEIKYRLYERPDYNWELHSSLMRIDYRDGYAFINNSGQIMFTITHDYHFSNHTQFKPEDEFHGGLLRVFDKNSKCGFLDTSGKVVIPLIYENATHFVDGLASVEDPDTGMWGYIDNKGAVVLPFNYLSPQPFSEGLAYAFIVTERISSRSFRGRAGYIDMSGGHVFTGNFKQGGLFKNGIAIVQRPPKNDSFMGGGNAKMYYIDKKGNRLSKYDYFYANPYNDNGYASVSKGGVRWEIIDKKGAKLHKGSFYNEPQFYDGKARVNIGNYRKEEYVYINETGLIIERE